jgi:hypothetical protein
VRLALDQRLLADEVLVDVEVHVKPIPASNGSTWSSNS